MFILRNCHLIFCVFLGIFQSCYVYANSADELWEQYKSEGAINSNLPDFSHAGFFLRDNQNDSAEWDVYNILEFGAIPDDNEDDHHAIQQAIDSASNNGGGIVFIPEGKYQISGGAKEGTIKISSSNIILKGEIKDGKNASVIYLKNPSNGQELGLLGESTTDLRSIAALAIEGEANDFVLTTFDNLDYPRGSRIISVNDTSNIRPNQNIRIRLTDPLIDTENPSKDNIDLVKLLTHPFDYSDEEIKTFGQYGKNVEYITKVRRVIDDSNIELYQPLRFDHLSRYSPTILKFEGISNVGVENLTFESAWQGQYVHHQPFPIDAVDESSIIRTVTEQDYGWVAIWGIWIADSWINNVVLDNFTQNIIVSNSAFIDVQNLQLKGSGGHAGLTYSSAYNILTTDIKFEGRYAHPVSIRAWTSGCVFSDLNIVDSAFNDFDRTGPFIDFHGLFPYENLFEKMRGFYVHSGGDSDVMPHSGVRNTLWNIESPEVIDRFPYASNELFNTAATSRSNMYKYYPSSFVVGVYGKNNLQLKINSSSEDRADDFMIINNLNSRDIPFQSLYEKQLEHSKSNFPMPPQSPILLE
ncbi:glycosyl hydrolase family 28-related protein [Aliiglaciecola lipolytica]|uniref:Rhamnogalacturonase A/B/Epimerase-like pectate lyase domain-containing protein n=1 Tax=Aliiglaciecola lipolytica E3 TaxID=1127673 RepID=K6YS84_9ALTE|nr:glycosyl hydrolase family 28-related protein [Aliiglaciecola lipolytica]GAC14170.1 hypothetical protein GLIP_1536 [Aliiglaciecola lipolytica E3]